MTYWNAQTASLYHKTLLISCFQSFLPLRDMGTGDTKVHFNSLQILYISLIGVSNRSQSPLIYYFVKIVITLCYFRGDHSWKLKNFVFQGPQIARKCVSQQLSTFLHGLNFLILEIVWIIIIILYTKHEEASDSTASLGIVGLIWHPNGFILIWHHLGPLWAPLVPSDYIMNLVSLNLSLISASAYQIFRSCVT